MATTTLHNFPELSAELRLEVWRLFLEDEVLGRRVVLWDGRVVPFAHLASPLLRVNVETRGCALKFYPTKVNVYSSIPPEETSSSPQDQSRDPASTSQDDLVGRYRQHALDGDDMAENVRAKLDVVETTTPLRGAVYLNPTRDLILHGYDCGGYFFAHQNTDLSATWKGSSDSTFCRYFSSKLSPSFYRAATKEIRVVAPPANLSETQLYSHEYISQEDAEALWKPFPMVTGKIFVALELEEDESDGFMQHISRSPRRLPGMIEEWWYGRATVRGEEQVLAHVTNEIQRMQTGKHCSEQLERNWRAELDRLGRLDALDLSIEDPDGELTQKNMREMISKIIEMQIELQELKEAVIILLRQARADACAERQAYWD